MNNSTVPYNKCLIYATMILFLNTAILASILLSSFSHFKKRLLGGILSICKYLIQDSHGCQKGT